MPVPKKIAVPCFYFCAAVFAALSLYGVGLYVEGPPPGGSLASAALYGGGVFGSLAGICYFGKEWDARKREERKAALRPPWESRRD